MPLPGTLGSCKDRVGPRQERRAEGLGRASCAGCSLHKGSQPRGGVGREIVARGCICSKRRLLSDFCKGPIGPYWGSRDRGTQKGLGKNSGAEKAETY